MTQEQRFRVLKDALDAIESARTKVTGAGLMLANLCGKDHRAIVALRGALGDLICARDLVKIEREGPAPAPTL